MDMDNKKRSSNFSTKEEQILISIISKYKHILENKKSDTKANSQKAACWVNIEKEFNALSGDTFRDFRVLKKKYENLKKRTKRKFADEKCYQMGTGGGPSKKIEVTDMDTKIKEILGTRIDGLVSQFGGDAEEYDNSDLECETIEIGTTDLGTTEHDYSIVLLNSDDFNVSVEEEVKENDQDCIEKSSQPDWSKYTPDMLKTPRTKALIPKKADPPRFQAEQGITNKLKQWTEIKTSFEETKQIYFKEEQVLKLKFLKEKHEQELQFLKNEMEMRIQFQKEEHKIKMEILELEKQKMIKSLRK